MIFNTLLRQILFHVKRVKGECISAVVLIPSFQQNGFYSSSSSSSSTLKCVGKFTLPKLTGAYDSGQIFLHRVFGYRGVVLFPWIARVFDRDTPNKIDKKEEPLDPATDDPVSYSQVGKDVKGKMHTFYQVLIDVRDCPYIRAQTDAVTFLGNQDNGRTLYAVPGLDYVAHEDVIPFTSVDKVPIRHDLFPKFLAYMSDEDDPPFCPKEELKSWQERNIFWLELSDVYKETTENIRVTVIPFYMGSRLSQNTNVYWWRYCIRLENLGDKTVQLRERHWRIFSLSGSLDNTRKRGVVGQEPILSPQNPAFQYSSHVALQAPSGHMWGTFRMEREDGHTFDCRIPPFSLESKHDDSTHAEFV